MISVPSVLRLSFSGLVGLGATLMAAGAIPPAPPFECRWTATPPVIDGFIDEAAWRQAQVIESFQFSWLPEGQRKLLDLIADGVVLRYS